MRSSARADGFTLLEILVVIVIIAIMTALLVPNLNSGGRWRDLNREASTLAARIRIAQDDAMLYGREYGIVFNDDGYLFVAWDADASGFKSLAHSERWMQRSFADGLHIAANPLSKDPILVVPEKTVAEREAAAAGQGAGETYQPAVYVLSSGEVTPFSATLRADDEEQVAELYVDALGNRVDEKGEIWDERGDKDAEEGSDAP